jgi:hypothetical protein
MKISKRNVKVELVGGLGNQLFGLAAGLFLARKTGAVLKLNVSQIGVGGTDHGRTIENFKIPRDMFYEGKRLPPTLNSMLQRISNKIARHVPLYRSFRELFLGIYTAKELGYEEGFWKLNAPKNIKGYFQTYKYADQVRKELMDMLILKREANWLSERSRDIELLDPIAIHMRRGDYASLISDFGILHADYYLSVLKEINPKSDKIVWIFTDSPETIAAEIRDTELELAEIICTPPESTPNETMILMSRCKTLIIGNSTFSWWSAFLASEETSIYAPTQWFKGRDEPFKLIPPTWNRAVSIWRETLIDGEEYLD